MPEDRAKRLARENAWRRDHNIRVSLSLNKSTDADIVQALEKAPSKMGYIKEAIRAKMREEE